MADGDGDASCQSSRAINVCAVFVVRRAACKQQHERDDQLDAKGLTRTDVGANSRLTEAILQINRGKTLQYGRP